MYVCIYIHIMRVHAVFGVGAVECRELAAQSPPYQDKYMQYEDTYTKSMRTYIESMSVSAVEEYALRCMRSVVCAQDARDPLQQ